MYSSIRNGVVSPGVETTLCTIVVDRLEQPGRAQHGPHRVHRDHQHDARGDGEQERGLHHRPRIEPGQPEPSLAGTPGDARPSACSAASVSGVACGRASVAGDAALDCDGSVVPAGPAASASARSAGSSERRRVRKAVGAPGRRSRRRSSRSGGPDGRSARPRPRQPQRPPAVPAAAAPAAGVRRVAVGRRRRWPRWPGAVRSAAGGVGRITVSAPAGVAGRGMVGAGRRRPGRGRRRRGRRTGAWSRYRAEAAGG